MKSHLYLFLVIVVSLFACQEQKNKVGHSKKINLTQQIKGKKRQTQAKLALKKQDVVVQPLFIAPVFPEPLPPYDPYDPYDPVPYPIDPPGYIPEPEPIELQATPKTIRDSLVLFPAVVASFDTNTAAISNYFDNKIAGSMEWKYLQEIGAEGRIFMRLLIDTKGMVREVTFLRFDSTELEILKPKLTKAALQMPLWMAAKNEKGEPVVSEIVFPLRIGFK